MTPEIATNAKSYDLPEGRFRRASTEQESVRFDGESVVDLIRRVLKYEIPEPRSMDAFYRELTERLNRPVRTNLPTPADAVGNDLYAFDALPDLDALAEAQGVSLTTDASDLATDDWPEDESVEDFIAAAMEGRHEEDPYGAQRDIHDRGLICSQFWYLLSLLQTVSRRCFCTRSMGPSEE